MAKRRGIKPSINSPEINSEFVRIYCGYKPDICAKTLADLVDLAIIAPILVRKWVAWHKYNKVRAAGDKEYPAYQKVADFLGLDSWEAARYLVKEFKF